MSLLARRYATALFQVAESSGATSVVLQDLDGLHALLGSPEGSTFLNDPNVSRSKLVATLGRAVEGGHAITKNALGVILERRRENVLPLLAAELRALAQDKAGEAVAVVETARPLADDDQAALREQLARLTKKRIVLDVRDNPDLLGGVRVRVGNTLYDGSLLGELLALQQTLLQAPSSASRTAS